MALYDDVVGQERAVAQLRAAAVSPVHAYLLVGRAGSGKRAAARSFAASLLCPRGGCGECRDCRLALRETHPDLTVVERAGPFISVAQAREIGADAARAPVEGSRKVFVLVDFHLVDKAGPALLKTIEEPSASTVFVVLADDVPDALVTIASRCCRIDLRPVPTSVVAQVLVADGVDPALAASVAEAAGGSMDRARLLASDPGFVERRAAWSAVPSRLDGSGAAVAIVVDDLLTRLDAVAEPLAAMQAAELAELDEAAERYGDVRGAAGRRSKLVERHKRELRRLRTDELRFGLAVVEGAYRDALRAGAPPGPCVAAVAAIDSAARELLRNPTEALFLQALFVALSSCDAGLAVAS